MRRYEENGKHEHIAYIIKYFYKLNIHYFGIFFRVILCLTHYFNYLRKLKETMFHILNI